MMTSFVFNVFLLFCRTNFTFWEKPIKDTNDTVTSTWGLGGNNKWYGILYQGVTLEGTFIYKILPYHGTPPCFVSVGCDTEYV